MDEIKQFLESSTIHGLHHISTSRKCSRLFWILVVMSGVTAAGVLIYHSFQAWNESPVTTTIETLPITEITFPKVTVCPPKNTYTNLNYDLVRLQNVTLDNETRDELTHLAVELLWNTLHSHIMKNLSKLEDTNRYYNWLRGYTEMGIPTYSPENGISYTVNTSAVSGHISSQHFGKKLQAKNVEAQNNFRVNVYPPPKIKNNTNATLHFEIEKVSVNNLQSGFDNIYITYNTYVLDSNVGMVTRNYTPPSGR